MILRNNPTLEVENENTNGLEINGGDGNSSLNSNDALRQELEESAAQPEIKTILASEVSNVDSGFTFSAVVPVAWELEAVPALESINIFDPAAANESSLEQSQIFIRQFMANDFLTLSTVTIHSREELTINGRPAVRYDIEKKAGVADFPDQPSWRNERHVVTDIKVMDQNPSVFYVIARRPGLDDAIYQDFLDSLNLDYKPEAGLVEPVEEFRERITLKRFGTYITPETSPVQPERFTGYHTGVDVEFADVDTEIQVRAIAEGEVIEAQTVSGYGGVVVIRHTINDGPLLALYGHLDAQTIPAKGSAVSAGEAIGVLGEGETLETDFERKHLHFAMLKGSSVNFRGYVLSENELGGWHDPLEFWS